MTKLCFDESCIDDESCFDTQSAPRLERSSFFVAGKVKAKNSGKPFDDAQDKLQAEIGAQIIIIKIPPTCETLEGFKKII